MKNTIKLIALLVVVVMASVIGFEVSAQAPITLGIKQIPQISFTGDPGKSYQIQYATKVDGSWNDLAVIPANPSGVYSYVDTEAVGQRFYRVSDYLTHIVMVTISPSSPMMSVVQISKTEQTDNVLIGRYDIKAQGISSGKLSNLRIRFHTTRKEISALFADIKLLVNGQTYSADSITGSFDGFVVFKNMVEALSIDNSVTVSIYGNKDISSYSQDCKLAQIIICIFSILIIIPSREQNKTCHTASLFFTSIVAFSSVPSPLLITILLTYSLCLTYKKSKLRSIRSLLKRKSQKKNSLRLSSML
jgi:hypothetical protein